MADPGKPNKSMTWWTASWTFRDRGATLNSSENRRAEPVLRYDRSANDRGVFSPWGSNLGSTQKGSGLLKNSHIPWSYQFWRVGPCFRNCSLACSLFLWLSLYLYLSLYIYIIVYILAAIPQNRAIDGESSVDLMMFDVLSHNWHPLLPR
jgi:hypothetical protein